MKPSQNQTIRLSWHKAPFLSDETNGKFPRSRQPGLRRPKLGTKTVPVGLALPMAMLGCRCRVALAL
jgi:hypothetical protein